MKKIYLLLLLLLVSLLANAQRKSSPNPTYKKMMYDMKVNFYTVCDSAEAYFKTIDKDIKGSGYKPFLRWKYENESKYAPSGNRMVDHFMPYNEYVRIKKESKPDNQQRLFETGGWKSLGPDNITNITGHYATGLGRVEFVEVNKTNNQQIYIGSRSGGLWRTSDGGATWSHNTDFLPASGVNAIAASPANFNSVLINVRNAGNGTSFGVYKSNDGGATFTPTAFLPAAIGYGGLGSNFKVYTIQYHPTIANLVFVGTSEGLYRSTDNLQTWTRQIIGGDVLDVDFHPTNANIIYIYDQYFTANKNKVLKSTDLGVTYNGFVDLPGNANKDIKISVSPTCPDCVFASSDNGIWKSTDAGLTYTTIQNPAPSGVSLWQAMPNDLDTTKFISGYLDLYRSTDSGTTFNQCTWWSLGTNNGSGTFQQNFATSTHYVHADNDYLDCVNGVFYVCTDGFLSKSTDNGVTWQKLSLSVGIRENYCVGTSQSNTHVSICGSQDNGTSIKNEAGWIEAYGADGMEGIILPLNPDYMIGSHQSGGRGRYTDGTGNNRTGVTPPGQVASWIAPLAYDPNNQMTVYSFGTKVHKSPDFGTTWIDLGTPTTLAGAIETAAIAENNSNIMVLTKGSAIEISNDGGTTFSNIKNGLPSNSITDVAFDPKDDATIIVTYDSYQNNGQKIYITRNSGLTWQNITYNLGNMPIYSVVIDHTNASNIYVGAAIGIYKKTINATTWTLYNQSLPNVAIEDLEINYGSNTIKAATWGRGLWEYSLADRNTFPAIVKTAISNPPTFTTPKATTNQFVTSEITYSGTLTDVHVKWAVGTPTFTTTNVIPMTLISGTTWKSITPLPDFPTGTKVFFKVFATGSNSDTSETYKFMYEIRPLVYCTSQGNSVADELIGAVQIGTINNVSTGGTGYTNFTAISTNLTIGATNTITITPTWTGTIYPEAYAVFIDYNKDGDFDDAGETVYTRAPTTATPIVGTFIVPLNASLGATRMRVSLKYNGIPTPCETFSYGQVEDYTVNIVAPTTTVNLKFNIEGFYDTTSNAMRTVKANQGIGSSSTDVDIIMVELRNPSTFAMVASTTAMLQTNGLLTAIFNSPINGLYYIVIKHRNALQTWSAAPVTISSITPLYDFTNSASKAYGNNMTEVKTGVWGIYSGDINLDEVIDGSDVVDLFNDIENSEFGDKTTDLNGDGSVDNSDTPFLLNNSENSVFSAHP
jgi:photosystem II stability/assembly factor-like uncharacterized protein